jgi:hypothetical protein
LEVRLCGTRDWCVRFQILEASMPNRSAAASPPNSSTNTTIIRINSMVSLGWWCLIVMASFAARRICQFPGRVRCPSLCRRCLRLSSFLSPMIFPAVCFTLAFSLDFSDVSNIEQHVRSRRCDDATIAEAYRHSSAFIRDGECCTLPPVNSGELSCAVAYPAQPTRSHQVRAAVGPGSAPRQRASQTSAGGAGARTSIPRGQTTRDRFAHQCVDIVSRTPATEVGRSSCPRQLNRRQTTESTVWQS